MKGGFKNQEPIFLSFSSYLFIYINYNTITTELSNFEHMLGVVPQTRGSGGNQTHDPYVNSLAHCLLDYQGTPKIV